MASEGKEAAWVEAQKKAFTRWANVYLRMKKCKIENLYEDFGDGLNLIMLLEVIGDEDVFPKKYNKNPKMRIHKSENIGTAFKYMADKGLTFTNCGPSDVLDGNGKIILGMMWTIVSSRGRRRCVCVRGIRMSCGVVSASAGGSCAHHHHHRWPSRMPPHCTRCACTPHACHTPCSCAPRRSPSSRWVTS